MRYPAVLSARINETTWAEIEAIAEDQEFSVGETVRMLLKRGITEHRRPKKDEEPKRRGTKTKINTRRVS